SVLRSAACGPRCGATANSYRRGAFGQLHEWTRSAPVCEGRAVSHHVKYLLSCEESRSTLTGSSVTTISCARAHRLRWRTHAFLAATTSPGSVAKPRARTRGLASDHRTGRAR